MPLVTIFGINAVGKDTIANEFKKKHPGTFITSASRLLMYHLGIIDKYGAEDPVTKKNYKKLENTSQDKIMAITKGAYKNSLIRFSKNNRLTILLSHLVFMLHIDKDEPVFLDKKDPPFTKLSSGLIQIKSKSENILSRRIKDNKEGVRERYYSTLKFINKHQTLCDYKWKKIISLRAHNTYITIHNNNLDKAVSAVEKFVKQL